jgi:thiosulfate/3-mercaptopyruvate sulfurtransferase
MWAARLWWMLRVFGFDEAAVLDGGWTAWLQEGRPVSTDRSEPPSATFTPRPRPELVVGKHRVLAALDEERTRLVDALTRREYSGELAFYGRAGHLPGAVNVPARRIVDRETQRFLPLPELRAMFAPVLDADRAITYCGAGIAAAADAFVLHLLGFEDVAVYDGSMMEWASDPDTPLATGEQ